MLTTSLGMRKRARRTGEEGPFSTCAEVLASSAFGSASRYSLEQELTTVRRLRGRYLWGLDMSTSLCVCVAVTTVDSAVVVVCIVCIVTVVWVCGVYR